VKVLVTGAGALLGQGIIRTLRASTLDSFIVGADPSPLAAGLYWADQAYLLPFANDAAYIDSITAILEKEHPDALLVGTDVELNVLATHRGAIERTFGTHVLVSDRRVVEIADDKWLTFEWLQTQGFPVPRSCLRGAELELIDEVGFPLIVKPRIGARSVGVSMARNQEELRQALDLNEEVIIQELVGRDDTEFTAGALVFDGECKASIVMRRELRDGNTYRAFTGPYPEFNDVVQRICVQLGPYGPVNLQFRLHHDALTVFEINARFSGTTPFRRYAGFNEVEMALRHLVFGAPIAQPKVDSLVVLRYWDEIVLQPRQLMAEL